eukprot:TRINITY_DN1297_c0_g1_i1.p1 TRINITY_DN1297_c0_g1~~TRINITY_DN1297_c0_g1_i1.p1  ORF type:complete len:604 (-),score=90.80 TRINITY_DN1297_c0_g1_i1:407-2011(-)
MPTAPACTSWSFEGSDTLKNAGQQEYVISKKRRSYSEYALSTLESSVSSLAARVETLEDAKVISLDGSGTTNPSKFFWQVMSLFEARAKPVVKMTYRAVGSGTGQHEFIGADNAYLPYDQDFGSGDIPIGASDHATLVSNGHEILHFPFQMGAMSIFHNIPNVPKSGEGALKVTGCIIARIFKRDIKTWDHSDIKALNPNLDVPEGQNIEVYHRVLGSSTTAGVTTYLHAACPSVWTAELVGKQITWPADTKEAQGSGQMSSKISSTPYAIGYIDSGHGHEDGLKEIELRNKDGTYLSSLEAGPAGIGAAASAAIAAGVMPTSPLNDFSGVSLHNQAGKTTWPIVAISYIYARRDLTSLGEKACLLKAFMEYIISPEGQSLLPAYGAVGIPSEVKTISQSALVLLTMPPCKEWSFEEASTIKGVGQADYIISQKRRSFSEYDDSTKDTLIAALKEKQQQLSSEIATLKPTLAKTPSGDKDDDDDGPDVIGIIALCVAAVSLLMNCVLFAWIMRARKRDSGGGGGGGQMFGSPQM